MVNRDLFIVVFVTITKKNWELNTFYLAHSKITASRYYNDYHPDYSQQTITIYTDYRNYFSYILCPVPACSALLEK